MFDKGIEFSAHEDYFALKEDYPIPTKLNIPDWYKKLEHSLEYRTIKGCMPFLDTITSGYLLKMPQDFYIRHNVDNKNEKEEKYTYIFLPSNGNYIIFFDKDKAIEHSLKNSCRVDIFIESENSVYTRTKKYYENGVLVLFSV
jgi:hypothetical protein